MAERTGGLRAAVQVMLKHLAIHIFTDFTMQAFFNSIQLFTRVQVASGSPRGTLEVQNIPGLADIRWLRQARHGHSVKFEVFVSSIAEGCVTRFAPHEALKFIESGKSTFDERVVLHRVGTLVVQNGRVLADIRGKKAREMHLRSCAKRLQGHLAHKKQLLPPLRTTVEP